MLTAIILIADHVMYKNGRDKDLWIVSTMTVLLDFILFAFMLGVT